MSQCGDTNVNSKKRSSSEIPLSPDVKKNPRLDPSMNKLSFVSILRSDQRSKSIFIHCRYDSIDAILILQKLGFPEDVSFWSTNELFGKEVCNDISLEEFQSNDIYSRYILNVPTKKLNEVDVTLICPAEKYHFDKYSSQGRKYVLETREMYDKITIPFLNVKPKDLAWVDNIINGTSEIENVFYRDEDDKQGFVFVLDYKWNRKSINGLHMLAISKDSSLTCLRDLTADHLPMLRNIQRECQRVIVENFASVINDENKKEEKLSKNDVLIFFHYPPTFYHLHVHFVHINSAMDGGSQIGRGHLLHDVIGNLEMNGNYYKDKVFHMNMGEMSPMLAALLEDGEEKKS